MSNSIKVEWYPKSTSTHLSEIYQKTGMVFSFVSSPTNGLKQCHEWVKCRDFLHDAVRTQITGNPSQIFGFKFLKGTNPEIDLTKMRMLVSKNGLTSSKKDIDDFTAKMKSSLQIIKCFEKIAKVKPSILKKIDTNGSSYTSIYMFIGDKMWIKSPFMVSMYTFLIRLGDKQLIFKTKEELFSALESLSKAPKPKSGENDNDLIYLPDCYKHLFTVAEKHEKLFPTNENGLHDIYSKAIDIGTFHNQSGILSLARKSTSDKTFNQTLQEIL